MSKATKWQLQEAKNRFSEVVDEALRSGPQVITRHGEETAVVVSFDEWTRLARRHGRRGRLIDVLRRAPKVPGGLEVTRSSDTGRDLEL
jgi:prevent-host-death family protein